MAFLTKQEVIEYLDTRPVDETTGDFLFSEDDAVRELVDAGNTLEGFGEVQQNIDKVEQETPSITAAQAFAAPSLPTTPQQIEEIPESNVISRAGEAFTEERKKGQEVGAEVTRELQEGEIGKLTAIAGQAAAAKEQFFSPGVKAIGSVAGEVVSPVVNKLLQGLDKVTDFTVGKEDKQAVSDLFGSIFKAAKEKKESFSPAVQRNIESALEFAELPLEIFELLGFGAVGKVGKDVVQTGVKKGIEASKEGLKNIQKVQSIKKEIEGVQGLTPTQGVRSSTEKLADQSIGKSNRILPMDKQEFVRISGGVDHGQWLNQRGIRGVPEDNMNTLGKRFVDTKNSLDEGISEIPGKHNPASLAPILDEAIELAVRVEDKKNINILQGIKKDIEISGGTTAKNIIEAKRIYERNNKFTYSKGIDTVSAEKLVRATKRDSLLREDLIDIAEQAGFKEFRAVSKEVQETRFLLDSIGKVFARDASNEIFDLSDRILVGTSFVNPATLIGLGAKKFIVSNEFKSAVAKVFGGKIIKTPTVQINRIKDKAQRLERETRKAGRKQAKETRGIKAEQEKQAILADELSKKGIKLGEGFTVLERTPLTRQEQSLIRESANKAEAETMAKFIMQERAKGNAVGEGFTIKDVDNTPLLKGSSPPTKDPKQDFRTSETSKTIAKEISETGGITFNLFSGKSLGGTKNFAVSPYPERSFIKKGKITHNDLADYIEKNADLLLKEDHSLGGWIDDATGETFLDVSITVSDKAKAIKIGRKFNQRAIFDLETFEEINTGGTGLVK